MPRGALQVVAHRPVVFVAQLPFHHLRQHRGHAAELLVAEGVGGAGVGQEGAVGGARAFGDHDHAVAHLLDGVVDFLQERLPVKGDFREQDDVRGVVRVVLGEAGAGGDPAGVAAHHFHHEHLGGGGAHAGHVQGRFAAAHGGVFGHRAEARADVGDRQVVVHGFGHVDGLDRVAHFFRQLGNLQAGVGGVAAAVVEEVADVVGLEHFDQPFVFAA